MTSQKLRGFVGQSMSGRKAAVAQVVAPLPMGATSYTITKGGRYRLVGGGAGGAGDGTGVNGGGSGGYFEVVRVLPTGVVLTISQGRGNTTTNGGDTTVTLPSGEVLKGAGGLSGANGGTGGAATVTGAGSNANDILLTGSTGGASGNPGAAGGGNNGGVGGAAGTGAGGAGSPGNGTHRGADGSGGATIQNYNYPGAGGAAVTGNNGRAGDGQVLLYKLN